MALTPGEKLDRFEITGALGSGAMGEVYRAHDERLRRDVAIKVLPEEFARDPDRLRRFEREARAAGVLNHPNILAIYDVGTRAGSPYVVSELLEGETLGDELNRGAMSEKRAIDYAIQIASGLAAAHDKGIVHRDIKPENLFITKDGRIKILDFGLAKLTDAPAINASTVPTLASGTESGVVLGTVGYMSPEQVRGTTVDHRSDIFSLGAVLYEMLSGARAFARDSAVETMNAILKEEPQQLDTHRIPIPVQLNRIVRRCLEKQPDRRFRSASDLVFALEALAPLSGLIPLREGSEADTIRPTTRITIPWLAAGLLGATALLFVILYYRHATPENATIKLDLLPPAKSVFETLSLSPDGTRIAFTARDESGKTQLWVRPLDSVQAQVVPDTIGASYPFWSPDGRFIAFFSDHKLRKAQASGGSVQTICDLINDRGGVRAGSWGANDIILFAAEAFGPEPIYQVSASVGSEPKPISGLEPDSSQNHHHWANFLPDGRHFIYFSGNGSANRERQGIYITSLDSANAQFLINTEAGALYTAQPASSSGLDYILFNRDGNLMAQAFDGRSLKIVGEPSVIATSVGLDSSVSGARPKISVSNTGVLIYQVGTTLAQMTWFDRKGNYVSKIGPLGQYIDMTISPTGSRIANQRADGSSRADIWLTDLARDVSQKLTLGSKFYAAPVWSPDESRMAFMITSEGTWSLWQKPFNGGAETLLFRNENDLVPYAWTPDNKFLLYVEIDRKTRLGHVAALPLENSGSESNRPSVTNWNHDENFPRLSPDGKFFVYMSTESSRSEIYVRALLPDGKFGGSKILSADGGTEPRWPRRSDEIFYIRPDDSMLMAVTFKVTGNIIDIAAPRPLFIARRTGVVGYDVSADGQRFLVSAPIEESTSSAATVVLNWAAALKR